MKPIPSPALALLFAAAAALAAAPIAAAERSWPHDILRETFGFTRETQSDVPWSALVQGCPARDCIPSIDEPRFVPRAEARFLEDGDVVLGLARGGAARAYPTHILDRHEIVNDVVAGEPIAITWCPLCGSGLAFVRVVDGAPVELGVSGLLRESDLVFYDRRTSSLWQQVTGVAFAGPLRGRRLEPVPIAVATWRSWREAHPETLVLAGASAGADKSGYGDYATSERLLFPVSRQSGRLHPKSVVWGVELAGGALAVTERRLTDSGPVAAEVGGVALEIARAPDGSVLVVRADGGAAPVAHRMFWFAWFTFHPDTGLVDDKERR